MKTLFTILIALLVIMGTASASEAPSAVILDCDGITETPVAANYSWTYPTGNKDEWSGVEACGMGPTDPGVFDSFDHVLLMEDRIYTVSITFTAE